jgi:hypothetical protein
MTTPPCAAHAFEPSNDNLPAVVAFTGRAQAGKSTAAAYLVERHGYTRVRFAGPLKDMMRAIGLDDAEIEGNLKEAPCVLLQGKTPRHAMQALGTEWGRDCIGPNFWVDIWSAQAARVIRQGGRVAVDDCRFPNENSAVRALGGRVIAIEGRGGISGGHISEAGSGAADATVWNVGMLHDLDRGVMEALAA